MKEEYSQAELAAMEKLRKLGDRIRHALKVQEKLGPPPSKDAK